MQLACPPPYNWLQAIKSLGGFTGGRGLERIKKKTCGELSLEKESLSAEEEAAKKRCQREWQIISNLREVAIILR